MSGLIASTSKSEESDQNLNSSLTLSSSRFEEQSTEGGNLRDSIVDVSWEQLCSEQFSSSVLMVVKFEAKVRIVV